MSEPDFFKGYRRKHGTMSGYDLHCVLGTPPCEACRRAKAEYNAQRRATTPQAEAGVVNQRSRNRALSRLSRLYPEVYRALYEEEKLVSRTESEMAR